MGRDSQASGRKQRNRTVSRSPERLDPGVRPTHYDLSLQVDPEVGRQYRGEVAIRIEVDRSRRAVELNAADLRIAAARVEVGERSLPAQVVWRPERERAELRFREAIPAGPALLRLRFSGRLRRDLRGLYGARAGGRRYAFTQLEAADARRFFPCFDEPSMKARFNITVTTARTHAVLSNAPALRVTRGSKGQKTVHFAETPPLSTYLVALAVGELEASRSVRLGKTPIRIWHVPGKRHLTAFALEAGRECLARLEQYFALPYPYAKLDLVAVPDFEAGAMENAGAVFFRETLLLLDPETATLGERKRAAEVICHELAHMWYGDLVTMSWWDDLWLNEAFATWMAFQVVDRWKPEWKMWHDFQHYRSAALRLDALRHTHPIHTPVRTPAEATANFDLITYEKGASVVRMLERYLGPSAFRKGVRRYIRRHRESNTVAADLWQALSEASGQPVEAVVRGWIDQEGYPVVSVRSARTEGRSVLHLRQQRFRAAPKAEPGRQRWPVPWVGRVAPPRGRARTERALVTGARHRVDLGRTALRFVYGNADEGGFYRPLHAPRDLAALVENLERLTPVERMGLVDHQWALARAGRVPVQGFLELLAALGAEPDPDVLLALRGPLGLLEDRLAVAAGGDVPARLRDRVAEIFGPALLEVGWKPARGEAVETGLRRAALISILGEVAEWPPVIEAAVQRFEAYRLEPRSLDPNLADAVVTLAARHGDAARYRAVAAAVESAATPQERRRFQFALADFRAPSLVDRTLARCLSPRVPTQDVAFVVARLLANRDGRERTWRFVKRRWPALSKRMPPMLATRLIEATPALGGSAHRRDVAAFFRAHPLPAGGRSLEQALERFDLDIAFCRLARSGLRRWLDD